MSLKRGERRTKWDPRTWMGRIVRRGHAFNGRRQAAPENRRPSPLAQATFWRRHPAPFAKRPRGMARRAARLFMVAQRAALLEVPPPQDDGWYALVSDGE